MKYWKGSAPAAGAGVDKPPLALARSPSGSALTAGALGSALAAGAVGVTAGAGAGVTAPAWGCEAPSAAGAGALGCNTLLGFQSLFFWLSTTSCSLERGWFLLENGVGTLVT